MSGSIVERIGRHSEWSTWAEYATLGLSTYLITMTVVMAGVNLGVDFVVRQQHPRQNRVAVANAFASWDGVWYAEIAREGYSYDTRKASNVAFFPAFPLLGRGVSRLTGLAEDRALVIVANACLLGFFVMLVAYVRERYPTSPPELAEWTVLSFGLWPVSFFARMAYSEGLFLLIVILTLYGIQRRWPIVLLAAIVGLATACRPLGVALILPLYLYLWQQSRGWTNFLPSAVAIAPVACWGIAVYMVYQHAAFGDSLAFVKTQENWAHNAHSPWLQRLGESLILKPIWSKYDPASSTWWARSEPVANPLFSLDFANPVCFVTTIGLIGYGIWRRHLNSQEALLAAGLLLIPYFSHGHRAAMWGQARYALSVVPAFLVLGQILSRLPPSTAAAFLAISAFFLGVYSALFASWYRFF